METPDRLTFTVTIDQTADHEDDRFVSAEEARDYIMKQFAANAERNARHREAAEADRRRAMPALYRPSIDLGGIVFTVDPDSVEVTDT